LPTQGASEASDFYAGKIMGKPLRRARAAPSARLGFLIRARSAHDLLGAALRAGTGPLRRVTEGATRPETGRRFLPMQELVLSYLSCELCLVRVTHWDGLKHLVLVTLHKAVPAPTELPLGHSGYAQTQAPAC